MGQERTTLEVIAQTVEEAIQNGLSQLGLPRESVDVEVLDTGSRGLFGIGGRQARVRLMILPTSSVVERTREPVEVEKKEEAMGEPPQAQAQSEEDITLQTAVHVVQDLLQRMKVRATVDARYITTGDSKGEQVALVEIQGDDLSILIGRRSETLNALQYITGLIVSKELDRWVPLMIDVQGYRTRRERQLRLLARRMAEQAIHTGRRQILEPMPPNERRLIHLELRDHPEVGTESIGEEPARKVTIFLKK